MFIKTSFIKRKLKNFSFLIFNILENNGNTNFSKNGEENFIDNLFVTYSKEIRERVVFDIGANIGEYSKMIEHKSSVRLLDVHLHLFEPTKRSFDQIKERFNNKKVTLNNFGASNRNETTVIFYDKEKSTLASLYRRNLDFYNLELNQSENIELKRLDEYIEEKCIEHIDLVKIDIEGHELKALEGFGKYLNSDFIDFIQFEYGGANLDSHSSLMEIYKFFIDKGFNIAKVMPSGLEIRKYSPLMDNFQYSNYVAVSKNIPI